MPPSSRYEDGGGGSGQKGLLVEVSLALAAIGAALFALFLAAGSAVVFAALLASFASGEGGGGGKSHDGEGGKNGFHGIGSVWFVVRLPAK